MSLLSVNISSQSACLLAASSRPPSLSQNLLEVAQAAGTADVAVADPREVVAEMLVPQLRELCKLYASRMGQPMSKRVPFFHERLFAGLRERPIGAFADDDLTGLKSARAIADALLAELIETKALEFGEEIRRWKTEIDQEITRIKTASMDEILADDFIALPIKLVGTPLVRQLKLKILNYMRAQLNELPEPLKGIPLRAGLIVAASELGASEIVESLYNELHILIQESNRHENGLWVLFEAMEILHEYESTQAYASFVLSLLQEALIVMGPGDRKYQVLGHAIRYAVVLEDVARALEFAEKQVDLAMVLIQKEQKEQTEEIDEDEARKTFGYDDFAELRWLTKALNNAHRHLDALHEKRLFDHAVVLAEKISDESLCRKVNFHLHLMREQLQIKSTPPSSFPVDS